MNESELFAPPKATVRDGSPDGFWDGRYLRMRSPGRMPAVCVGCAATDGELLEGTARLRWVNPWTYLWFFVNPLVLMIAYLICVKHVKVGFVRCGTCVESHQRWTRVMWGALAGAALAFVGSVLDVFGDAGTPVAAILTLLLLIVAVVAGSFRSPRLVVLKRESDLYYIGRMRKAVRVRLNELSIIDAMPR
jgi:hypothetical protein